MDNLARNAMLARQAGMSYGKWKSLQPIVPILKPEIPEGWKKCAGCGIAFFTKKGNAKYHDEACRLRAADKRKNERRKEKRNEKT